MSETNETQKQKAPTTPRIEKRFKSLGLPNGFRFNYYIEHADIVTDLGGDTSRVLANVNSYLAAHSTATEARDQFTSDLEKITGFTYLTKQTPSKKDPTKMLTTPAETEAEYVGRLKVALVEGFTFTTAPDLDDVLKPHIHPPAKNPDAVLAWLQSLADARTYTLDARVSERQSKEKGIPQYATKGAEAIYAGNEAKGFNSEQNWHAWQKKFAKDTGTVLAERTGNAEVDKKVLALAIVADKNKRDEKMYQ